MKIRQCFAGAGVACVCLLAVAPVCATAETYLTVASAFHPDVPVLGHLADNFVQTYNAMSEEYAFQLYDPGALTPVAKSVHSVSEGIVDAAFTISGYWQDELPAAALFSAFPFGFTARDRIAWLHDGDGRELYQQLYDRGGFNVKVVPCGVYGEEVAGWFKEEISGVDDLDGLKLRAFGFAGEVFARFGAETELLFADGIASALHDGRLDGAEFSTLAVDTYLGIDQTARYAYFPGWHQPSTLFEFLINGDVWEALPERAKARVETACLANITHGLATAELSNWQAFEAANRGGEVEFRRWSPEDIARFREAWEEVVAAHAAEDRFFRMVWDDISTFLEARAEWNRFSTPVPE